MPSVEHRLRLALASAAFALAAGCASVSKPVAEYAAAAQAQAQAPADAAAPASAIAVARPAVDDTPVSPTVQQAFDEARAAFAAGRIAEAEKGFRVLTQSNPELGGPFANLGLVLLKQDKTADAVLALEQAVKAGPNQPVFFNHLGIAYRREGQFEKARIAYERAIELDPQYAAALLNLGILHDLYLWDGKTALELYDRYLAAASGDPAVTKWVADLKNRRPQAAVVAKQEKP